MYVLELGGEDDAFAAAEAAVAASDVERIGPGLALAATLDPGRFRALAFSRRAGRVLARCPADVDRAATAVQEAALDGTGSVAVRARDVRGSAGIDTQLAEEALGTALVDAGYAVDLDDPDRVLLTLFSGKRCVIAWEVAATERNYGDRKPTDRPFFQPGSMDPLLARAVVNLARVDPGDRLLDPMCGTGGLLIEGGLIGAVPVGTDAQVKMIEGARRNLRTYLGDGFHLARADATRLPFRDGTTDAFVVDAPYGRQSRIATHDLGDLVAGALEEGRRVADRGVLVADRSWHVAAETAGFRVESVFERRVHRSLTRYVHLLR